MGAAFKSLEEKLHKERGFMKTASGSFAPVFIHLSDGDPTDNFEHELKKLQGNNWFRSGVKVAIAIGNDANREILKKFTGSDESVLTVHNKEDLKALIRFVTVTSSQVASSHNSSTDNATNKQGEIEKQVKGFVEGNDTGKIEIGSNPDPNAGTWGDEWD